MSRSVKIKIDGITKVFKTEKGGELTALKCVTLDIFDKEFVSVIGPSGCGKTTLLNIIAGLIKPNSGQVVLDGREINGPGRERGVVFQQESIFMWRRVIENVQFGPELRGLPKEEYRRIAIKFIDLVGLKDFVEFYPKELSGGMKKRVQVAMVFANDPEVLLMDEPFGNLDYPTKISLQKELLRIWAEQTKTTLFVTHDIEEALFLSDRIVVMSKSGGVEMIVDVPFPRPRTDEMRLSLSFDDMEKQLWKHL